ncbi:hypothetical protein Bbelb_429980 [Branchiostoma belcheri]|nr:hypothetical protein Bbelb_429980 [Branchiostoma belcheri]
MVWRRSGGRGRLCVAGALAEIFPNEKQTWLHTLSLTTSDGSAGASLDNRLRIACFLIDLFSASDLYNCAGQCSRKRATVTGKPAFEASLAQRTTLSPGRTALCGQGVFRTGGFLSPTGDENWERTKGKQSHILSHSRLLVLTPMFRTQSHCVDGVISRTTDYSMCRSHSCARQSVCCLSPPSH